MAARTPGNDRGDPGELFRNETHWSKLKQPMVWPVCYAYVKWPWSPGTRLALTSTLNNLRC
jgi:hypothetical protein